MNTKQKVSLSLFLFALTFLAPLPTFGINPPYGTGILTITNQDKPRTYTIDSDPLVLDPQMIFSIDITGRGLCTLTPAGVLQNPTTWQGGAIHVTIDPVANNNTLDRLSCTVANPAMTTAYDIANRQLTITAPNTVSYTDIQNTLRTLAIKINGQCTATRNVRIWVDWAGYRFVNTRNGRIYAWVENLQNGDIGVFSWFQAIADFTYNGGMPRNFGMIPYFGSITSAAEQQALHNIIPYTGWLGARSVPAAEVTGDQVNAGFDYSTILVSAPSSGPIAWVAGPDKGKVFWTGGQFSLTPLGGPVSGRFSYWIGVEPNGNNGHVSCAGLWVEAGDGWHWGDWNEGEQLQRYLVEYGGMPDDQNVITVQVIGGNTLLLGNPF